MNEEQIRIDQNNVMLARLCMLKYKSIEIAKSDSVFLKQITYVDYGQITALIGHFESEKTRHYNSKGFRLRTSSTQNHQAFPLSRFTP